MTMRLMVLAASLVAAVPAVAANAPQFWNETSHEMTGVYLAPAGTDKFGPNQALNDPDKAVSADERLALKDVTAGKFDVKLVDSRGRTCLVRGVIVRATGKVAFSVSEKQLTECK